MAPRICRINGAGAIYCTEQEFVKLALIICAFFTTFAS